MTSRPDDVRGPATGRRWSGTAWSILLSMLIVGIGPMFWNSAFQNGGFPGLLEYALSPTGMKVVFLRLIAGGLVGYINARLWRRDGSLEGAAQREADK